MTLEKTEGTEGCLLPAPMRGFRRLTKAIEQVWNPVLQVEAPAPRPPGLLDLAQRVSAIEEFGYQRKLRELAQLLVGPPREFRRSTKAVVIPFYGFLALHQRLSAIGKFGYPMGSW